MVVFILTVIQCLVLFAGITEYRGNGLRSMPCDATLKSE